MAQTNRTAPSRMLLVGDYADGDLVKDLWVDAAVLADCDCASVKLTDFAREATDDCLALVNRGIKPEALLREVIAAPGGKVLYLPPSGALAAWKVIEYCRNHRVYDAISMDVATPAAHERKVEGFRDRLIRLLQGKPDHYEPISHDVEVRPDNWCFIATPFIRSHRRVFDEGVHAAMDGLGIRIHDPGAERRLGRPITRKIRDMIDESKIVIGNIRKVDGGYNPNVFYELGYAQAQGKIVMPFRHPDDPEFPPIDIRDEDYFDYEDAIDLALQLYWGLKAKVAESASA